MVKAKTVYKTDDGQEFDSKAAAERHAEIVKLREAYEAARNEFGIAVLRGQKTADGELFTIAPGPDYYLLMKPLYSPPRIIRVHLYWTHWDWFLDDGDKMKLRIKYSTGDSRGEDRTVDVSVSELYARIENARAAFLNADQEAINQRQAVHDELAANPEQIGVAW